MMRREAPAISSIGTQPRGANSCRTPQSTTKPEPIHHNMASGNLVQLVTNATNRQYVTRIFRISLQLFAETIDMRIDIALVTFVISAPNSIEQSVSGPCAAGFRRKQ